MLDYFCIFTKGGALLWTIQLTALRGNPIDVLVSSALSQLTHSSQGRHSALVQMTRCCVALAVLSLPQQVHVLPI